MDYSPRLLADDHRDSKNHSLLIQVWKDYVANHFEQPAAGSIGIGGANSMMFYVIIEAPSPPPPTTN
jgi:hypothetical protein